MDACEEEEDVIKFVYGSDAYVKIFEEKDGRIRFIDFTYGFKFHIKLDKEFGEVIA